MFVDQVPQFFFLITTTAENMFCLHASCTHKDSMCQTVFDFTHKTHTIIKPEPSWASNGHFTRALSWKLE